MTTISSFTQRDLLDVLRLCAHRLLIVYDKTLDPDFWEAFEQAASAFQYL